MLSLKEHRRVTVVKYVGSVPIRNKGVLEEINGKIIMVIIWNLLKDISGKPSKLLCYELSKNDYIKQEEIATSSSNKSQ